jgi:hypothetical protein
VHQITRVSSRAFSSLSLSWSLQSSLLHGPDDLLGSGETRCARRSCCWRHVTLTDGEPVHRVSAGYGGINGVGGIPLPPVATACAACSLQRWPWKQWRPEHRCCHCGRPVTLDAARKLPMHVVCGAECRLAAHAAQARRKPSTLVCRSCGERFVAKRAHAYYCSAACKQRAYRRRLTPIPLATPA